MVIIISGIFKIVVYHVQNEIYTWHIETKDLNGRRMCLYSGQTIGKNKAIEKAKNKLKQTIKATIKQSEIMESKNVTVEYLQIGKIRYSFNAIISYSQTFEREGEFSPSFNHVENITGELDSDIHAWDTEKEEEYIVTDPLEEAMVLDWVDWFTQLEKAWEN